MTRKQHTWTEDQIAFLADIVVLDAPSESHLAYRPDRNLVWKVVKAGTVVAG